MSLLTPILANQDVPSSTSGSFGAFRAEGRIQPVLVIVFFLINAVVLLNAILHPPTIGYDAISHLQYVTTLADGRLVTPTDSAEFFSPPIPYLFPAALMHLVSFSIEQAAKAAQLLNVLVSIGLTLFLLKICELIDPGKLPLKLGALSFLGVLPVYYKTFAFVRGEPFVAFFAVLAVYCALQLAVQRRPTLWHATALGVSSGIGWLVPSMGLASSARYGHLGRNCADQDGTTTQATAGAVLCQLCDRESAEWLVLLGPEPALWFLDRLQPGAS